MEQEEITKKGEERIDKYESIKFTIIFGILGVITSVTFPFYPLLGFFFLGIMIFYGLIFYKNISTDVKSLLYHFLIVIKIENSYPKPYTENTYIFPIIIKIYYLDNKKPEEEIEIPFEHKGKITKTKFILKYKEELRIIFTTLFLNLELEETDEISWKFIITAILKGKAAFISNYLWKNIDIIDKIKEIKTKGITKRKIEEIARNRPLNNYNKKIQIKKVEYNQRMNNNIKEKILSSR